MSARLTITLPDELQRALKEAAARRGTTMADLVCESLVAYGIKPRATAAELVARARRASGLSEDEAMRLAQRETANTRRRR